ncbi:hypothetical protein BGX26_008902, partial [Mortierella sp. AD094]
QQGLSAVAAGKHKKFADSLGVRDDPSSALADALHTNEQLNAQIASLQANNAALQADNSALHQQLDAFNSRFHAQDSTNQRLSSAVQDLQDTLAAMKKPASSDLKKKAVVRGAGESSSMVTSASAPAVAPTADTAVASNHTSYASALSHNLSAEQMDLIKQMKPALRPFASKTGSTRVVTDSTPT